MKQLNIEATFPRWEKRIPRHILRQLLGITSGNDKWERNELNLIYVLTFFEHSLPGWERVALASKPDVERGQ